MIVEVFLNFNLEQYPWLQSRIIQDYIRRFCFICIYIMAIKELALWYKTGIWSGSWRANDIKLACISNLWALKGWFVVLVAKFIAPRTTFTNIDLTYHWSKTNNIDLVSLLDEIFFAYKPRCSLHVFVTAPFVISNIVSR